MVNVTPTSAMTETTSFATSSVATMSTPTTLSFSNHNGQVQDMNAGNVSPTSYQLLLKQVENLRKENSTLKAELKNNTSHISMLETEASRMKNMVLMLGNPVLSSGSTEADTNANGNTYYQYSGLPPNEDNIALNQSHNIATLQSPVKIPNGTDQPQDVLRRRPEFLLGLQTQAHHGPYSTEHPSSHHHTLQPSISPSPSLAMADVIRKMLASLKTERASGLRTLNLEEQKKEYYLKQLKELTGRLDSVGLSDSDKFTKPNDKMRQQIEVEIANLKKTMEQTLGTSDVMQERLDARLKHIHFIENEICSLEQHLRRLEVVPTSPSSTSMLSSYQTPDIDGGVCVQHGKYSHNGVDFSEMSTQTAKFIGALDGVKYEEEFSACDNSNMDTVIMSGKGKKSRAAQTVLSCLGARPHHSIDVNSTPGSASHYSDSVAFRMEHKRLGSIDSLRSHSDVDDTASMHSFTNSLPRHLQPSYVPKKESLLSPSLMQADKDELVRHFLKMCETREGCWSMKQTGCISLIVQIMHDGSILTLPSAWPNPVSTTSGHAIKNMRDARISLSKALRNLVTVTGEEKWETQILSDLEFLRRYCEDLYDFWINISALQDDKKDVKKNAKLIVSPLKSYQDNETNGNIGDVPSSLEKKFDFRSAISVVYEPPIAGMRGIMRWSNDESVKSVINEYGGLYAVAELFILHCRCVRLSEMVETSLTNERPDERAIHLLRRFIGVALTNLTYGDTINKTALIQMPGLIDTILAQMNANSEEMQQVMALLVRNLSWQPDEKCRDVLRQKNVVAGFVKFALKSKREDNLKSLLSALWNLSGHCPQNRVNICSMKGALAFLVSTLTYRVHEIKESGGGILRNISSVVATNEEYRKILREKNCLQILLSHLKSASLTIVSNACGTLWNLSARNAHDQKLLWDLGAVPMLRNLVHSKHSVIAQGSAAALRNLLASRPGNAGADFEKNESTKLKARKQRSVEYFESGKTPQELDNFSPRHHALSSAKEKMVSPRSAQRHSLQEEFSSSPVPEIEKSRRFHRAALHGSLGSLPTSEFTDTISPNHTGKKYIPAARNSNSYPDHYSASGAVGRNSNTNNMVAYKNAFGPVGGGTLKDVMMFSDVPQTAPGQQNINSPMSNLSLRECFKMLGDRKSSLSTSATQAAVTQSHDAEKPSSSPAEASTAWAVAASHARSPYYPTGLLPNAWVGKENASLNPSGTASKIPEKSLNRNLRRPQSHNTQNLLQPSTVAPGPKMRNVLVPQSSEDLYMRLKYVNDDYDNDDDPVNYSLQYRDEHMTPGIQSPRTEEIYELASTGNAATRTKIPPPALRQNYMHSQMVSLPSVSVNGPATKSDGGLSGLSSCVESTGSSAPTRPEGLRSGKVPGLDSNAQPTAVNYSADHNIVDPSAYDYGYEDEKPTNFSAIYTEEPLYEPIQHEQMVMQPYVPVDPSSFSSDQINPQSNPTEGDHHGESILDRTGNTDLEAREADDKFDTGGRTPAHYYHHRSGRNSGIMTPHTLDDFTPMMFSRTSSLGSVSDGESIHSSVTSEPASRMMSGAVSPSHLPDSPSQSMPMSPRRSPPPTIFESHPADVDNEKLGRTFSSRKERPAEIESEPLRPTVGDRIEDQVRKLETPGYVTSMPHKDEVSVFKSEGAMSVMTKFSALTIDSTDKIQPITNNVLNGSQAPSESKVSLHAAEGSRDGKNESCDGAENPADEEGMRAGQRAVLQAGYITSLPTNDEIKNFMHEGTLSPMTAFSEISCLKDDNDGFLKSTGSVLSMANSTCSNRVSGSKSVSSNINSFASRSSATGASVPPPPPKKEGTDNISYSVKKDTKEVDGARAGVVSDSRQVEDAEKENEDALDSDDSESLPSSSSDDDDLLQECIQRALSKKSKSSSKSSSSKYSSKSSRSSKSKDKTPLQQQPAPEPEKVEDRTVTNPSPVADKERRRVNIKQKIQSADMKLKGVHIVDYIDNLIMQSGGPGEPATKSQSKQVISDTETLQQSYSVRKKLRENEKHSELSPKKDEVSHSSNVEAPKTTGLLPNEPPPSAHSKLRIQAYMREGITTYATEGTPIEMSRSTSLSNLTIDSDSGENSDLTALQNKLKTSQSVPDIQSTANGESSLKTDTVQAITSIPSHIRDTSLGGSDRSSPVVQDSREILEVLGKQIESLSLSTVENVITSQDPGYTRSLPHTDEIRKYDAEGSQFGGTEFSALTIDSSTRIAPGAPTEILQEATVSRHLTHQPVTTPPTQIRTSSSTKDVKKQSLPTLVSQTDEVKQETPSRDVIPVPEEHHISSWNENGSLQPSSHYNNENDNLGMKEEHQNYMIEDTPFNLSGPGSLSSLDFESDDDNDLLNQCISSALPPERKPPNTLYPGQFGMPQQNPGPVDNFGRHNHGMPDGKVDSPTIQQTPFVVPQVPQPQNSQPPLLVNSQSYVSNFLTPTEEQFMAFQREAEVLSAQLLQQSQQHPADTRYFRSHSQDPLSSSVSLSQPTEGFYHISRQPSAQDSDLSISSSILGEKQAYDAKHRDGRSSYGSSTQGRKSGQRQHGEKVSGNARNRIEKSNGKNFSQSKDRDITPRHGKNRSRRARDSSSGSSSSYRRQQRHLSGNQMCNCQVTCSRPSMQSHCFNHGPVSASTSHLDGGKSQPGPRHRSANSTSKNSIGVCEHNHHHHQQKPSRPRKNLYRPSVIQMYPPLKDMVGVLEGVATVAARGDKVVADRNFPQQYSGSISKKSSSSSLVRSATFINENPSDILLESLTPDEKDRYIANSSISSISPPRSQRSSKSAGKARTSSPHGSTRSSKRTAPKAKSSPQGSMHSLKAQPTYSATKPKVDTNIKAAKKVSTTSKQSKSKKMWNGIKKLLSPSDDPSTAEKKSTPQKATPKKSALSSNTPKHKNLSQNPEKATNLKQKPTPSTSQPPLILRKHGSSSSLSLSSSSASNHSSDAEIDNAGPVIQNAPYGLLPKSPSLNASMRRVVKPNIPQSRSMGLLFDTKPQLSGSSIWRKTPPQLPSSTQNLVDSTIKNGDFVGPISSESKTSLGSACQDVWVSKRAVAADILAPNRSNSSEYVTSHLLGQNHQRSEENFKLQISNGSVPGFQSPPRTQSPRVVQQVAPFNYKPSPRKTTQEDSGEKNLNHSRKINPDCKQTPV